MIRRGRTGISKSALVAFVFLNAVGGYYIWNPVFKTGVKKYEEEVLNRNYAGATMAALFVVLGTGFAFKTYSVSWNKLEDEMNDFIRRKEKKEDGS